MSFGSRPTVALAVVALAIATWSAYFGGLSGQFLFDSELVIAENPHVRRLSPKTLLWGTGDAPSAVRPVVMLSFALSHALGGLDVSVFRAGNVAIHTLCALLLFGIVRRTVLRVAGGEKAGQALAFSFAVALLWTLHPLNTQAVTYVAQRAESLMGLFFLLTFYAAVRGMTARSPSFWYVASVLACGLAVLCKSVGAMVLPILLLYDRAFWSGSLKRATELRGPLYLGLAGAWVLLGAILYWGPTSHTVGWLVEGIDSITWMRTQPGVILHYLTLVFWPRLLFLDYGSPIPTGTQWVPAALAVASLLGATLWALVRHPRVGFLMASFFLILAPTSSVIPIPTHVVAEHRMYLALTPLIALVLWGAISWGPLSAESSGLPPGTRQVVVCGLVAVVALAFGLRTVARNRDYRSATAMWNAHLPYQEQNPRVLYHLARALARDGELDEAALRYGQALEVSPDLIRALTGLGVVRARQHAWNEAEQAFTEALRRSPGDETALFNLARTQLELERPAEAVELLRELHRIDPRDVQVSLLLARAQLSSGDTEAAVGNLEALLQRFPRHRGARALLARARDTPPEP